MENVFRALVFDGQVSLTVIDTTEIVKEGKRLHTLSSSATLVLGKALSAMAFMSACLKEKAGEISLSTQSDGSGGNIGISGNQALRLRGYIENPQCQGSEEQVLGQSGALTIIRDDGYNRPFVGACAFTGKDGIDGAFEEYFKTSEQLPTFLRTDIELDAHGECIFAGVAVLQPLPFADTEILQKTKDVPLEKVLKSVQTQGLESAVETYFPEQRTAEQKRFAQYKCNCSREYLTRVLVTLGRAQAENIIKEDGEIKVHCHYCNSNYVFTQEDVNELFK